MRLILSNPYKVHLRLAAGLCILKLAQHPAIENMISQREFQNFAVGCQDPCYEVREALFTKMVKYLGARKLGFRYLTILLLVAFEPEESLRESVRIFLQKTFQALKATPNSALPETLLYRLIHMLAHHPDFSTDLDDIKLNAKYIEFYLDLLANPENVSYLYFLASGLKSAYDVMGESEVFHTHTSKRPSISLRRMFMY